MKIRVQVTFPAFVRLTRRRPDELQKRFMLYVPVKAVLRFVPKAFPFLTKMVTNGNPDRLSKKARVVELLGEGASTTTKPRFMFPLPAVKV
jgi:hypothetical protein